MFEDSFIGLLRQYPEAVSDRKRFFALMKDFFPEQPMQVNLIKTAFDLGITEELNKTTNIGNALAFRFVKRLVDEYGVSRINADWAVSVWCVCYGKQALGKPCDIEISRAKQGAGPAIRNEIDSGSRQYSDLFLYKNTIDGYEICGFTGSDIHTLIFPNTYNGKRVSRIGKGVFENSDVQTVVITDNITLISDKAFKDCQNLRQLILPKTLLGIGEAAFAGCVNLTTVAFPSKLGVIGKYAFMGTGLKQAEIPDFTVMIGDGAFMDCLDLGNIRLPKRMNILSKGIFKSCKSLKKITLPDNLLMIKDEAFLGCSSLLDVIIPDKVLEIGENAFADMNSSFNILCTQKSAAERYARSHHIPFQIVI